MRIRRRRYLVKKGMQLRYLVLILTSALLPTVLIGICLYWLIFSMMAQQLGFPESIAYNLLPVISRVNHILIIGLPILLLLMLGWGLFLSHRIAGPIYRLERALDRIAKEGDFSVRVKFRKKDELGSIAEGLNKVLERAQKEIAKI